MPAPAPQDRAAARALRAERRAEAFRLSVAGLSYAEIGKKQGRTRQAVGADIKRVLAERIKDQHAAVDEYRAKQDAVLDEALKVAHEIMNNTHYAHSNGRIVRREVERPDGSVEYVDVLDDAPRLAAADRLIRISESRRKLHGWDAPSKTEVSGNQTVTYQIALSAEEMEQL